MTLLNNSENVGYNAVYIARFVGSNGVSDKFGIFIIRVPQYQTSGYLNIRHKVTSVLDTTIPQY